MQKSYLAKGTDIITLTNKLPLKKILTVNELHIFENLAHKRRQQEWLQGRIATKWLLSNWLRSYFSLVVDWLDLGIENDSLGKPFIISALELQALSNLKISISHENEYVASVVTDQFAVGIDVASAKLISQQIQNYYLSVREQRLAEKHFGQKGALLLWTVKEAYLKALGLGFHRSPKTFEVDISLWRKQPSLHIQDGDVSLKNKVSYKITESFCLSTVILIP